MSSLFWSVIWYVAVTSGFTSLAVLLLCMWLQWRDDKRRRRQPHYGPARVNVHKVM